MDRSNLNPQLQDSPGSMSGTRSSLLVDTFAHVVNSGNWSGFMAALPEDFVLEFIVFDGPNICLNRDQFKNYFPTIPGFKLGQNYKILQSIRDGDQEFLHITTTMQFMAAPSNHPYELFFVAHTPGGKFTKLQMHADSKFVAELKRSTGH